jgi:hypothetical protein
MHVKAKTTFRESREFHPSCAEKLPPNRQGAWVQRRKQMQQYLSLGDAAIGR